jgi:hypothetical protein
MRIGAGELALITRRFAMLLEAGLTIEQCLDALIEQAQGESARRILAAVRAEVLSGRRLRNPSTATRRRFPRSTGRWCAREGTRGALGGDGERRRLPRAAPGDARARLGPPLSRDRRRGGALHRGGAAHLRRAPGRGGLLPEPPDAALSHARPALGERGAPRRLGYVAAVLVVAARSPALGVRAGGDEESAGTRGCCACRSSVRSGEASTLPASPRASPSSRPAACRSCRRSRRARAW